MKYLCSQLFAVVESVGVVIVRLVETGSSRSVTAREKLLFSSRVGGGWRPPQRMVHQKSSSNGGRRRELNPPSDKVTSKWFLLFMKLLLFQTQSPHGCLLEVHSEKLGFEGSLHAEVVIVIQVDCAVKKDGAHAHGAPSSQSLKDWEVNKRKKEKKKRRKNPSSQ